MRKGGQYTPLLAPPRVFEGSEWILPSLSPTTAVKTFFTGFFTSASKMLIEPRLAEKHTFNEIPKFCP